MGTAAYGVYGGMEYLLEMFMASAYFINLIAFSAAAFVGILLYFVLVIKLKAVKEADLKGLPKGRAAVKLAKKMRLL